MNISSQLDVPMEMVFQYDKANYITTCILKIENKSFVGVAKCHKKDITFANARTGESIALLKATIKFLEWLKSSYSFAQIELSELKKSLSETPFLSKEKSFVLNKVQTRIRGLAAKQRVNQKLIESTKADLQQYIAQKDKMYAQIELARLKKKIQEKKNNKGVLN